MGIWEHLKKCVALHVCIVAQLMSKDKHTCKVQSSVVIMMIIYGYTTPK